ncbi:MAG: enoyl-CoA hydratase [Frankiaceae bacterium]|jgi:enoyl-CoA hydratase|nr:enoyl-CoA hydratase [Frankiaceae bacterium]
MDYDDYTSLSFERSPDGVLTVWLDRPAHRNATDRTLHGELARVWSDIERDDDARAVVFAGRGEAFCAGGDLDLIDAQIGNFELVVQMMDEAKAIVTGALDCTRPVVAAVHGAAFGAGLALALVADISIVAEDAQLSDGHVRLGIAAGDHAVLLWPLLCGMAKAKYHLLTGAPLDGREAERIGLVSRCVPADRVLPEAMDVAAKLAAGSPTAIRWTRQTLNHWYRAALPAFEASLAHEMLGFFGPDVRGRLDRLRSRISDEPPG